MNNKHLTDFEELKEAVINNYVKKKPKSIKKKEEGRELPLNYYKK